MEDVLNSFDASHNILNIFHPCEGTERTTSWIKTFCLRSFYSDKKFLNLGLNRICKTFKHSPLVKEEKITHLFLSDPIPKSLLLTWLMWPWRVKIHATSPCLTSCCQFWHSCCWRWNKTKAILLMSEPAKSHVIINFYRTQVFGNVLYVTLTRYLEKLFRDFGELCFTLS